MTEYSRQWAEEQAKKQAEAEPEPVLAARVKPTAAAVIAAVTVAAAALTSACKAPDATDSVQTPEPAPAAAVTAEAEAGAQTAAVPDCVTPPPATGTTATGTTDAAATMPDAAQIEQNTQQNTQIPAAQTLADGETVYRKQCIFCHGSGAAGAPVLGDAAQWQPRIAQGYQTLLQSTLKGKGLMSPQGGTLFSDAEIARAVVFMANESGAAFDAPAAPSAQQQPAETDCPSGK